MWMSSQSMMIHLHVKISSKTWIISFVQLLSKKSMGSQKSIICAKYACEFVHQHFVMYTDMISRGSKNLVDEVTTLWCYLKACHAVCNVRVFIFNFWPFPPFRASITTGKRVPTSCQSFLQTSRSRRQLRKRQHILWITILKRRSSLSRSSPTWISSSIE